MSKTDIFLATARGEVYRLLALVFSQPDAHAFDRIRAQWPIGEAGLAALGSAGKASVAAARCRAVLEATTIDALREAHVACFGHAISKECPPYEAEYGQTHIFQKTQTLADISGFYRAFGLELSSDFKDRPDHIAAELEFMEFLCRKEAYGLVKAHDEDKVTLCRRAQRDFLSEHLGRWVFGFLRRLKKKAPGNPYATFARLLEDFLTGEMRSMGLKRGRELAPNETRADTGEEPECARCPLPNAVQPVEGSLAP